MDDIDGIILVALRQLSIGLKPDVVRLKQLDTDTLFGAVVAFLKVIDPSKKVPTQLPKETARGYRVCETLARVIKELGYPHEIGFDQFLYPNEIDIRKLLGFLMQQMPQQEEERNEVLDAKGLFNKRVNDSLKEWKSEQYVPQFLRPKTQSQLCPLRTTSISLPIQNKNVSKDLAEHYRSSMRVATTQVWSEKNVIPSILQFSSLEQISELHNSSQLDVETQKSAKEKKVKQIQKVIANGLKDSVSGKSQGQGQGQGSSGGDDKNNSDSADGSNKTKGRDEILSLEEYISQAFGNKRSGGNSGTRSTAFEHATDFTHNESSSSASSVQFKTEEKTAEQQLLESSSQSSAGKTNKEEKNDSETQKVESETKKEEEQPKMSEREKREKEKREKKEKMEAEARQKQEALQEKLDQLVSQVNSLERESETLAQTKVQLQGQIDEETHKRESLEEEYQAHKSSLEMLDNFQDNLKKLQEITVESGARLVQLAEEWEKHRGPLLKTYRENKKKLSQRKTDCREKLEKIKTMRLEMKQMIQQLHDLDLLTNQMRQDYEKMPKSANRNAYTVRILEIVKNVKKQQADINKILIDIRDIQKDINRWEDTLKRSYAAADEAVYASAKKDNDLKQAYSRVVDLHLAFTQLVEKVDAKGKATSEIRQLELKCDALESQNHSLNFDKIEKDLKNVLQENEKIIAKLQKQSQ